MDIKEDVSVYGTEFFSYKTFAQKYELDYQDYDAMHQVYRYMLNNRHNYPVVVPPDCVSWMLMKEYNTIITVSKDSTPTSKPSDKEGALLKDTDKLNKLLDEIGIIPVFAYKPSDFPHLSKQDIYEHNRSLGILPTKGIFKNKYDEKVIDEYNRNVELEANRAKQRRKEEAAIRELIKTGTLESSFWRDNLRLSQSPTVSQDYPQKGFSEDLLFRLLMKLIPSDVRIDVKMNDFYPDICIMTSLGVNIDIEIDEPYDYKTKRETHYEGSDDIREEDFSKYSWYTVRFSEEQVITKTFECAVFVMGLITLIYSPSHQSAESIYKGFKKLSTPRWTKEQSRLMAIENYRDSYKNNYCCPVKFKQISDTLNLRLCGVD